MSFDIFSLSESEVSASSSLAFCSTIFASGAGKEAGYLLHQGGAAGAELVVRELLYRRIYLLDLVYVRLYLFAILIGF